MLAEPAIKRTIAFIDGQNLHKSAKEAFGYTYPNYDVNALTRHVCAKQGWSCCGVRFYSGVPEMADDPTWHSFWAAKLRTMSRQGVSTITRPLRYRDRIVPDGNGQPKQVRIPEEKGIDVRIAIDIIMMAHRRIYDVALVFSQDQDLSEVADEIKTISREQSRWIKMASAFPSGTSNQRGINKTDWVKFDRQAYDQCVDINRYLPRAPVQTSLSFTP